MASRWAMTMEIQACSFSGVTGARCAPSWQRLKGVVVLKLHEPCKQLYNTYIWLAGLTVPTNCEDENEEELSSSGLFVGPKLIGKASSER
eukprot:1551415-Heterocapsa_arctica.AAC.1